MLTAYLGSLKCYVFCNHPNVVNKLIDVMFLRSMLEINDVVLYCIVLCCVVLYYCNKGGEVVQISFMNVYDPT